MYLPKRASYEQNTMCNTRRSQKQFSRGRVERLNFYCVFNIHTRFPRWSIRTITRNRRVSGPSGVFNYAGRARRQTDVGEIKNGF